MLVLLAYLGLGYLSSVIEHFPHHLLSCISCFGIILIVVFCLFDKKIYKIVSLSIVTLFVIAFLIFKGGIINKEYETFRSLDDFGIEFVGDISITMFTGTAKGNAEVAANSEEYHTVKLNGRENGKYTFEISDDSENVYTFEYYFDKDNNTIVLNKTN